MSLAYPLTLTADDALTGTAPAARTRHDAEALAGDAPVLSLETEWLKPASSEVEAILKQAESGDAKGFIQVYEDADEKPVLAVTYWKLAEAARPRTPAAPPEALEEAAPAPPAQRQRQEDHTDDLYFRHDKARKSRRKPHADPRQMDLFISPDPRGYEHTDPNNPNTMLTDEEGDGTTFGGSET